MPRIDYMRKDSLTTTDVDTFSKFVDLTGWKVIWGLNLGENNPEKNSDEAVYVAKRLKNALYVLIQSVVAVFQAKVLHILTKGKWIYFDFKSTPCK